MPRFAPRARRAASARRVLALPWRVRKRSRIAEEVENEVEGARDSRAGRSARKLWWGWKEVVGETASSENKGSQFFFFFYYFMHYFEYRIVRFAWNKYCFNSLFLNLFNYTLRINSFLFYINECVLMYTNMNAAVHGVTII